MRLKLFATVAALATLAVGVTLPRQGVDNDNLVARDPDTGVGEQLVLSGGIVPLTHSI